MIPTAERQRSFLNDYEAYVRDVLEPTRQQMRTFFGLWRRSDYWSKTTQLSRLPSPSPIQRVRIRIKRPESVVDKIARKPVLFPDGVAISSVETMRDAVAGRIIAYFLANLPLIDREVRTNENLEISEAEPPVAYLSADLVSRLGLSHLRREDKDSGYASIHYILRFRGGDLPRERRPWFELQVRTLAEDLWGEVEHVLGYKPNKRTSFAVRKTFQIISSQLSAIDEHFNLLFEELGRFQGEGAVGDDDPLNAENLPGVLNEIGAGCAQKEIDGLLKLLNSRGIETVGALRETGTARRIETIRHVYLAQEGRSPRNFEIVASLPAIRELQDDAEIANVIQTQIQFLKAWDKLKQDLELK